MDHINAALRTRCRQYECIGIVDMFGFEQAPQNRLQQLCINAAAEAFQSHYSNNIFRSAVANRTAEGFDISKVCPASHNFHEVCKSEVRYGSRRGVW